jgi:hypothetical protein
MAFPKNPGWIDWILNLVANNGVQLPSETILNVIPPLVATDNPTNGSTDVTVAPSANNGDVMTTVGGVAAWATPASPPNYGWQTASLTDFTLLPNQTLGTNGAVTIGTLSGTRVNSANDATTLAISNGAGLVIQPVQSVVFASGSAGSVAYNAPGVNFAMTSIIPGWHLNMPFRISAQVLQGTPQNASCVFIAVAKASQYSYMLANRESTSGGAMEVSFSSVLDGSGQPSQTTWPSSTGPDIIQICAPSGLAAWAASFMCSTYSSGFPAASSYSCFGNTTGQAQEGNLGSAVGGTSGWNLVLGMYNPNVGGAASGTIERLLVEYKAG